MRTLFSSLTLILVAPVFACASSSAQAPVGQREPAAKASAQTEERYLLALASFDHGDYETAAAMFAQLAAELPDDISHDHLRHLLIQHAAWSLLGSHDMGLDAGLEPGALARAERMLEAYLAYHEQLRPDDATARVAIYELLAEVQLRRDNAPPPDAHERLQHLAHDAYATIRGSDPAAAESKGNNEDRMVREIVVDTRKIPWAQMDDPRVQAFFRSGGAIGGSLTSDPFGPFNPTRVLVRGKVEHGVMSKHTQALLAAARPQLERCYEDAIADGVPLVVRLDVSLAWQPGTPADIEIGNDHELGARGELCVEESLRAAERAAPPLASAQPAEAALHLTFFVQPERRLHRDYLIPKNGLGPGITYDFGEGPPGIPSDIDW